MPSLVNEKRVCVLKRSFDESTARAIAALEQIESRLLDTLDRRPLREDEKARLTTVQSELRALVLFDLETTGIKTDTARIVQGHGYGAPDAVSDPLVGRQATIAPGVGPFGGMTVRVLRVSGPGRYVVDNGQQQMIVPDYLLVR